MVKLRDMLFVNTLEKQLGRKLTEIEMSGEFNLFRFRNGRSRYIKIPLLDFPYDLMPSPNQEVFEETVWQLAVQGVDRDSSLFEDEEPYYAKAF